MVSIEEEVSFGWSGPHRTHTDTAPRNRPPNWQGRLHPITTKNNQPNNNKQSQQKIPPAEQIQNWSFFSRRSAEPEQLPFYRKLYVEPFTSSRCGFDSYGSIKHVVSYLYGQIELEGDFHLLRFLFFFLLLSEWLRSWICGELWWQLQTFADGQRLKRIDFHHLIIDILSVSLSGDDDDDDHLFKALRHRC